MPRVAIFNMTLGFFVLFLGASHGVFLSLDLSQSFLRDLVDMDSWNAVLARSSHGHSGLFATIHIVYGLTLPYSCLKHLSRWQTAGLTAGTLSMSVLLYVRGLMGPTESFDLVGIAIGLGVSAFLVSLSTHMVGLWGKLRRL